MQNYEKKGKSLKYKKPKDQFNEGLKKKAGKYKNKIMNEVKEGGRGLAYSAIRRLGEGPLQNKAAGFTIASLSDKGFYQQTVC